MINILLMSVIGGPGTIYGAAIGVVIFVISENYIQLLMRSIHAAIPDIPQILRLLEPDRWMLIFGLIFVLSVYFFPKGVVGRMRAVAARPSKAKLKLEKPKLQDRSAL